MAHPEVFSLKYRPIADNKVEVYNPEDTELVLATLDPVEHEAHRMALADLEANTEIVQWTYLFHHNREQYKAELRAGPGGQVVINIYHNDKHRSCCDTGFII